MMGRNTLPADVVVCVGVGVGVSVGVEVCVGASVPVGVEVLVGVGVGVNVGETAPPEVRKRTATSSPYPPSSYHVLPSALE